MTPTKKTAEELAFEFVCGDKDCPDPICKSQTTMMASLLRAERARAFEEAAKIADALAHQWKQADKRPPPAISISIAGNAAEYVATTLRALAAEDDNKK